MVDPTQPPSSSFSNPIQPLRPGTASGNIISNVPREILTLPSGSVLSGLIIGRETTGKVNPPFLLQTLQGTLSLATALPLQIGSKLTLELFTKGPEWQAKLVSVDGKPPPPGSRHAVLQEKLGSPILGKEPPQQPSSSRPQQNSFATVTDEYIFKLTRPATQADTATPTSRYEASATHIESRNPSETPRSLTALLLSSNPVAIKEFSTRYPQFFPPAHTSTPTSQGQSTSTLSQGSTLQLTILKTDVPPHLDAELTPLPLNLGTRTPAATPTSIIEAPLPPAGSAVLRGIVIGTEKSGETVIHTDLGTIKLQLDKPLPSSTDITFALTAAHPPTVNPTSAIPQRNTSDGIAQFLQHWGSLKDTLSDVKQNAPQLERALEQHIPRPDHNLGARLLGFIQAVKQNDITKWVGKKTTDAFEAEEKGHLLKNLGHDISTFRDALQQEQGKTWQLLTFPVFDGEQLHQPRMYIRDHEQENKDEEKQEKGTRFIVELDVSAFGSLQFDGLVRKGTGHRSLFDLIIRSHESLPEEVRSDIRGIFQGALEITGMEGGLAFQRTPEFPVNPAQEFLLNSTEGDAHEGGSILV